MEKKALVVGGSNGIGLAIAIKLREIGYAEVNVLDKEPPPDSEKGGLIYHRCNLANDDLPIISKFGHVNTLVISAGFGRIAPFDSLTETEIINSFKVNSIAVLRIIKAFYDRICSNADFYCAVMGSIAGLVSSPLFSVYGASKAALCKCIESINVELEKHGAVNRILNVSPGHIEGTSFYGGENDLSLTFELADAILSRMFARETLFIPDYDSTYRSVLWRYNSDPHRFGLDSYDYKMRSGRLAHIPQVKVGYLSGTFDLFHIGHLNLLRRAKAYCDYLVVGVHRDASHKNKCTFIPYEERIDIVGNIKYVDKVIEAPPEDSDAYERIGYECLFVGSDYKGTERFNRYEEYFKDKKVEIVYFPYTLGTSSTKLRKALEAVANEYSVS